MRSISEALNSIDLESFKRETAKRRGQETYQPVNTDLSADDFSYLKPSNLEANDYISGHPHLLIPKPVHHCGHSQCANGQWSNPRRGPNAPEGGPCKRCELPRRWLERLAAAKLPFKASGMYFRSEETDEGGYCFKSFPKLKGYAEDFIERLKEEQKVRSLPKDEQPRRVPKHALYLCGTKGTGKTSFMYAMAREACYYGYKVKFLTHQDLRGQCTNSWNNKDMKNPMVASSEGKDDKEAEVPLWLKGVEFLFLDEFGGNNGSMLSNKWWLEFGQNTLIQIYEKWLNGKLQVIISSNMSGVQFLESTQAGDRMKEMFIPVQMVGESKRAPAAPYSAWIN